MITIRQLKNRKKLDSNFYPVVNNKIVFPEDLVRDEDVLFITDHPNKINLGHKYLLQVTTRHFAKYDDYLLCADNLSDDDVSELNTLLFERQIFLYIYTHINGDNGAKIFFTLWDNAQNYKLFEQYYQSIRELDHRKLGKQLAIFHLSNSSPGMIYWDHNGCIILKELENYLRSLCLSHNYQEIKTPIIAKKTLWEQSGHLSKYSDNILKIADQDSIIRPMNCPMAVNAFSCGNYSFKDLPIRIMEFGLVHRNEPSGAIQGLFRCISFTQDDGHIFCRMEHVAHEIKMFLEESFLVYQRLGFSQDSIQLKLALRPTNRLGSDHLWDQAEHALQTALEDKQLDFIVLPDEGAFYGPKIEIHVEDKVGRAWQCGTIQLDMMMAPRLNSTFYDENGAKEHPVIIHRAILGSMERMIGILLEHHKGSLPYWMAPVQVIILTVSNKALEYGNMLNDRFKKENIRSQLNYRGEHTLGKKIRQANLDKIPYIVIVGEKESQSSTVSLHSGFQDMEINQFINYLQTQNNR